MTDMYQTPGDRLRFEILLKSLTEGSLNLAVLSDHDQVLDFYGNLFDQRLREKGETHIEFCASTNSEQLVQKFNEILSELTLNQALEKDAKHAPRRYLVFRDSILMQDFELQLLARLVNGFPAGNISVILLLKRSGSYRSKLDAFGKNLLQWEVEAKISEVKEPLKDWVADTPDPSPEQLAAQLLKPAAKPSWRVPGTDTPRQEPVLLTQPVSVSSAPSFSPVADPGATAAGTAATTAAAAPPDLPEFSREPRLADFADTPAPEQAPVVFQSPSRQMPWGWLFLVLLLSLAAFAYMYRDLVLTEVELMKKYLLRGTPAAATPASAADAAASAQLSASAPALVAASQPTSAAASSASEALAPVAVPESVTMASAAASAAVVSPVEKASTPASTAQTVTPPRKTDTKADTKASTDGSDATWLKQLPTNSFVVQLAAFDTEEEVLAFKRSNKLYEKTRVLSPPKKGSKKRYFILVAGPFDTKVDADAYMRTSPLLAKAWLRSSQSIISQFDRP